VREKPKQHNFRLKTYFDRFREFKLNKTVAADFYFLFDYFNHYSSIKKLLIWIVEKKKKKNRVCVYK
jgi:hypothetical protein